MLEIFFLTSNPSKLAHLSYLGRLFGVKIIGFRQKTYLGSYSEPDSPDREFVLEQSYESALIQVNRGGLPDSAIFILEDTSVRIDALSRPGEEFPGTRVKFWMQENSFDGVNSLLKGRKRSVSVRSDLVMHVPATLRKYLGLREPYFHCHGAVSGEIAAAPSLSINKNLLYPWLDPSTFNGWFVPDGAQAVLSDLPVIEANKYDFRLRAFEKLLSFLGRYHLYTRTRDPHFVQRSFAFSKLQRVIVLLGQTCAGKTTGARFLSDNGNFVHLEASDFMRAELVRRHGPRNQISVRAFAEAALREQPWVVAEQVAEIVRNAPSRDFVVSGLRASVEIDVLKAGLPGINVELVWIKASRAIRYQRAVERARDGAAKDLESFRLEDNVQLSMGLRTLRRRMVATGVPNEGAMSDFHTALFSKLDILDELSSPHREFDLSEVLYPLQRRLILALGALGGDREFFTSGQLAKFTQEASHGLTRTEKDNVSRFFTQASYPFFEIRRQRNGTAVRLSNTGTSIYRQLSFYKDKKNPVQSRYL
jgi:dephospho-CoA kinase/inosine/xanthosine triphosphate pyrophosphatase family protein